MAVDPGVTRADAFALAKVSGHNRSTVIRSLGGHIKAVSLVWMKSLGLPLLDGVIVRRWSRQASDTVARFCRQRGFVQVLLRIDKKNQRWTRRRGGFLVDVTDLPKITRELMREDIVSIVLEPASPYADLCSFGSILDPRRGTLTIEVVGPGFDASDILRSDVQPHERFEVTWPTVQDDLSLSHMNFYRTHLADSTSYLCSVNQRLEKIARCSRDPYFADESGAFSQTDAEEQRAAAMTLLEQREELLLLRHLNIYKPVPLIYLRKFVQGVVELMIGLAAYGISLGPTSIAASFISEDRMVYWDFFPANAEEFKLLYEVRGGGRRGSFCAGVKRLQKALSGFSVTRK